MAENAVVPAGALTSITKPVLVSALNPAGEKVCCVIDPTGYVAGEPTLSGHLYVAIAAGLTVSPGPPPAPAVPVNPAIPETLAAVVAQAGYVPVHPSIPTTPASSETGPFTVY